MEIQRFIRTGDPVERVGSTAREIDRLISELGRLYAQHVQAARLGMHANLEAISARIVAVKSRLNQL